MQSSSSQTGATPRRRSGTAMYEAPLRRRGASPRRGRRRDAPRAARPAAPPPRRYAAAAAPRPRRIAAPAALRRGPTVRPTRGHWVKVALRLLFSPASARPELRVQQGTGSGCLRDPLPTHACARAYQPHGARSAKPDRPPLHKCCKNSGNMFARPVRGHPDKPEEGFGNPRGPHPGCCLAVATGSGPEIPDAPAESAAEA